MTFSISAGGTKAQTLSSLASYAEHDHISEDGKHVANLLHRMVYAAPDNPAAPDGTFPSYSVSAWGHSGGDSFPSLNATLSVSFQPVPDPVPGENGVPGGY